MFIKRDFDTIYGALLITHLQSKQSGTPMDTSLTVAIGAYIPDQPDYQIDPDLPFTTAFIKSGWENYPNIRRIVATLNKIGYIEYVIEQPIFPTVNGSHTLLTTTLNIARDFPGTHTSVEQLLNGNVQPRDVATRMHQRINQFTELFNQSDVPFHESVYCMDRHSRQTALNNKLNERVNATLTVQQVIDHAESLQLLYTHPFDSVETLD